ncbi:hypothetical protein FQZ97_1036620 [compost metagenome]
MDQLEGFLDHLGGITDHVEQADGVGLLQPDREQPRALAGAAGDLVEHRPVAQRSLVVAAFDLAREKPGLQFLAAHRLGAAGGELPLHLGG